MQEGLPLYDKRANQCQSKAKNPVDLISFIHNTHAVVLTFVSIHDQGVGYLRYAVDPIAASGGNIWHGADKTLYSNAK